MNRWYFAASVVLALCSPAAMLAQGTGQAGTGIGGGGGSMGQGASGSGLAGTANTTLLGDKVNLNFNSVFGTAPTIANFNSDPFAAYRPAGSGTGSTAGSTGGGAQGSFAGGTGTGAQRTNTGGGLGANTGGLGGNTGGLGGANANRGGLNAGTGLGGGALGGGLGGGALGGGGMNANRMGGGFAGGNAMTMGGNRGMGGAGFLGGAGAGSFLGGGGSNNQQAAAAPMGYIVNYDGRNAATLPATGGLTAASDMQQRLLSTPGIQGARNFQVFTRGDTAILQGQVGSDYAKQLAGAMIRLEPGVYEVENKLEVVKQNQ